MGNSSTTTLPAAVKAAGHAIAALTLLLTGCAVDAQGRYRAPPAHEPAIAYAQAAPTVYTGWRLFQDRCASCHGAAATGTSRAPNLLPYMRTSDPRRFITEVLYRYDWGIPAARGNQDAIDALVEGVMSRTQGQLTLAFRQGEPQAIVHIADLHDYLAARGNGSLGPRRPAR